LARASDKEIVESAGARFFHDPGFEIPRQGLDVKTPAKEVTLVETDHFFPVFRGKGKRLGPVRVEIKAAGDDGWRNKNGCLV